jgi:hypothetical protein
MNTQIHSRFYLRSRAAVVGVFFVTALVFCLSSEGADPEGVRVIWKREMPDDVQDRYERRTTVHQRMSPTEKEVEFWKNDPSIEKIEIINGRDVRITTVRDLFKLAEDKQWRDQVVMRYVIQERFGAFNFIRALANRDSSYWMIFDDPKVSLHTVDPAYEADRGRIITVTLAFCEEQKLSLHDLLRKVIKFNPEIREVAGNRVFVCEIRTPRERDSITAWISGDHLWVDVGALGVSDFSDVVRAYLKKHPSTLPKDFPHRHDCLGAG